MSSAYIPSSMLTELAIFDSRTRGANAALQNPAVARCCQAWQRAFQDVMSKKNSESEACLRADKAFRNAMPALSGEEGIRDFVACATHGLLIGAITEKRATKLLYAAQVATAALARQRNPSRRTQMHAPQVAFSSPGSPATGPRRRGGSKSHLARLL